MRRHRTTARGIVLALLLAGLAAVPVAARSAPDTTTGVPQLVFPLVAKTMWWDNYGDPRGNGSHAGIDIMAPHRAPVVAVEAGRVKYWDSGLGGCMLYLYGRSGTMYMYIHLNNDLTPKNDNRGECNEVAFAVPNGAKVAAGEQIAWNGDSGDANGNPHLHFEVHPGGGTDVNPYQYLKKASKPLFAAKPGSPFSLALRGELSAAGAGTVELEVESVRHYPGGRWLDIDPRSVALAVSADADVDPVAPGRLGGGEARAEDRRPGRRLHRQGEDDDRRDPRRERRADRRPRRARSLDPPSSPLWPAGTRLILADDGVSATGGSNERRPRPISREHALSHSDDTPAVISPTRLRVAQVLAFVALLAAFVGALGPAEKVRTTYSWPPSALPDETPERTWFAPLFLSRHRPEALTAAIPCALAPPLRDAGKPVRVLATARTPAQAGGLAITRRGVCSRSRSGSRSSREPGRRRTAECAYRLRLEGDRWSLEQEPAGTTREGELEAMPAVFGFFSALDLRAGPAPAVEVRTAVHATRTTTRQALAWTIAALAIAAALLLVAVPRRPRPAGSDAPSPRDRAEAGTPRRRCGRDRSRRAGGCSRPPSSTTAGSTPS